MGATTGRLARSPEAAQVKETLSARGLWSQYLEVGIGPDAEIFTKGQILSAVWNYDFAGDAGVVESYMSYLRRKVDTGDQKLLHTVRGVGYVLRTPRGPN